MPVNTILIVICCYLHINAILCIISVSECPYRHDQDGKELYKKGCRRGSLFYTSSFLFFLIFDPQGKRKY